MSLSDSQKVSALAGALATVAISSLGGPVAASGAALGQLVKLAQSRYLAGADSRGLQRTVEDTVRGWAQSEHISEDDRRLGLTLAAEVIGKYGADWDTIAGLDFDAGGVTAAVVRPAKAADSYWGSETHYGVAERAIEQTYAVLIRRVRAEQGPLLDAVQAARSEMADAVAVFTALGKQQAGSLGELQGVLIAGATDADVMVYLRNRIKDWDKSVWLPAGRKPSSLERRLRGRESETELPADEALVGQRLLAVLGGPGAGKTWLARRYARMCAQQALAALEAGADLLSVEIPVYTTWDGWSKANGGTRQAIVAASFASGSGHSDLGGQEIQDRLTRTFTSERQPILAVLDSLDEAADTAQSSRLGELESIDRWRLVVTSRPSAWQTTTGVRDLAAWRVMTLLDLDLDQVAGFIDQWFADNPARAVALANQLKERAQTRQLAATPLLLTFLCLLTQTADNPGVPLPASRRALYQQLLERLVASAWANSGPGQETQLDTADVVDLLTRWAWQAVEHSNTPAGLGNWPDTFTPTTGIPREFSAYERRALDNIAPRTSNGKRRFIHRTVLEHLIAEHIATQDTATATTLLLPHVWFDADWEWVVPAAIASHNRAHQGELFESVMARISYPHNDPARAFAYTSAIELLLRVIVESEPEDWSTADAEWLGRLRSTWMPRYPSLVALSAHWTASNSAVLNAAAGLLAESNSREELLDLLSACAQTSSQRSSVRELLLALLASATPEATHDLVTVLCRLSINAEEKEVARNGLLHLIEGGARDDQMSFLTSALISLDPNRDETDRAFTSLLNAFFKVDLPWFTRHVDSLRDYLGLAHDGPHRARGFLMSDPDAMDAVQFARLLIAFPRLVPPLDADKSKLRDQLMGRYSSDGEAAYVYLMFLPLLEPSASQRQEVMGWLLNRASTCDVRSISPLVAAFALLDPSDDERASFRRSTSRLAARAKAHQLPDVVAGALVLGIPAEDRNGLLTALVRALTSKDVDPESISAIIEETLGAGAEKEELRSIVLNAVPEADAFGLARLGLIMFNLDPTLDDLGTLREAATELLGSASGWEANTLVGLIAAVNRPAGQSVRRVAAGLLTDRLPNVGSVELAPLLVLTGVSGVDEQQMGHVRQAILDALDATDSPNLEFLVNRLRAFSTFDEWLAWLSEPS